MPKGWLTYVRGHPCFDPVKDLAVPVFKAPSHYARSPLLGSAPRERDLLMFFRGDAGLNHGADERCAGCVGRQQCSATS